MIFVNLILENANFSESTESLVTSTSFVDLMNKASIFNNVMILDTLLLFMLTVKNNICIYNFEVSQNDHESTGDLLKGK